MQKEEMEAIVRQQEAFFQTGKTIPVSSRLKSLKQLEENVRKYEPKLSEALRQDLGKCAQEGYMSEIGLSLSEIAYLRKHLRHWASDRTVPTPLTNFPARSFVRPEPRGVVLILSPWNYPCLLSLEPLA
ncbi:MAG: aldehyde dehydrogenase family protein, partial [Oscillibacter sp.]|nr:aldehyde dehydrogenase family protein [Oscillibacter sp.]